MRGPYPRPGGIRAICDCQTMNRLARARAAVAGHVEWVDFARVERVPRAGEIVHAEAAWEEAAGGGAVAAVQLVRLGADTTFFTALGDDARGRAAAAQLERQGVRVHAVWRPPPQPRPLTFL